MDRECQFAYTFSFRPWVPLQGRSRPVGSARNRGEGTPGPFGLRRKLSFLVSLAPEAVITELGKQFGDLAPPRFLPHRVDLAELFY